MNDEAEDSDGRGVAANAAFGTFNVGSASRFTSATPPSGVLWAV